MNKKIVMVLFLIALAFSTNFVSTTGYFGLNPKTVYVEKTWNTLSTPNLANPNVEFAPQELYLVEVVN